MVMVIQRKEYWNKRIVLQLIQVVTGIRRCEKADGRFLSIPMTTELHYG